MDEKKETIDAVTKCIIVWLIFLGSVMIYDRVADAKIKHANIAVKRANVAISESRDKIRQANTILNKKQAKPAKKKK